MAWNWTINGASASSASGFDQFFEVGTYVIQLTVRDDQGLASAPVQGTVNVTVVPPPPPQDSEPTVDWAQSFVGASVDGPAVGPDGRVWLIGEEPANSRRFSLYAFNPDGSLSVSAGPFAGFSGSVTVSAEGSVYVAVRAAIYAFDSSGSLRWVLATQHPGPTKVVIASDGRLFTSIWDQGCRFSRALSLNPDGSQIWNIPIGGCNPPSPISLTPDEDAVIRQGPTISKFEGLSGSHLWSYPAGVSAGQPAVDRAGNVYFMALDNPLSSVSQSRLFALDQDGNFRWMSATLGVQALTHGLPAAVTADAVWVVTADRNAGNLAVVRKFSPLGQEFASQDLVAVTTRSRINRDR